MEQEENNTPRTTDAGIDNGASLDPRAETDNPELQEVNSRILELQQQGDAIKEELRKLSEQRQTLAAGAIWSQKVGNMNEAEVRSLQEAINQRQANVQQVGVQGIESRENVNGQNEEQ